MMRLYIGCMYLLSLLVFMTSCNVTKEFSLNRKDGKELTRLMDTYFGGSDVHSGFALYDAESMELLYGQNADQLFTPASNVKILTLYAALKFLPSKLKGLEYIILSDTTYVRGTGDPGFLNPNLNQETVVEFLLNQKELRYVTRSEGVERWGPGWSWDDYPYYYATERSIWPIYGNLAHFTSSSVPWSGLIVNHRNTTRINRLEKENIYNVSPDWFLQNAKAELDVPFIWSESLLFELMRDSLQIDMVPARRDLDFKGNKKWESVTGSDRDEILERMMKVSDNFLAEQLLINISANRIDFQSGYEVIDSLMKSDWKEWNRKIRWVDGSGLSRYNLLSPTFISEVLGELYKQESGENLWQYFNKRGESITITNRYHQTKIELYAKTGTMSGVHCLSGYLISKSGKRMVFSFMHNNYVGSNSHLKEGMDAVLTWIGDRY